MKILGMIYIMISFIPWIIYWILCGLGFEFGVFVSLIISTIIFVVFQIVQKNYDLMNITSFIYFSLVFIVTYFFNSNFFVLYSGFTGYFVLFLMAVFSIIIKQPFTFKVSKRDWPEVYWKEKSFLFINNVISIVWMIIFLVNSFLYLLLELFYEVIFSNFLIIFGVIFSIVFPEKASKYFVEKKYVRLFKKFDWRIEISSETLKNENDYDVIIVGAGIGGLTCGALLAKKGVKVLVLEQNNQVGGYCSSFKIKEFTFNSGVADVSGLWEKGPISFLLHELELNKENLFVKNSVRYVFKGKQIDVRNFDDYVKILSEMFPHEEKNILAFFDDVRKAYEECYSDAEIYGVPLPPELIAKVFGLNKLVNYPKEHPYFYDWLNKTYRQKLDEYFKDENLKTLLCALLTYVGTTPEKTLASTALTASLSYYIYGGYFPKGGAQKYAETLKNIIEKYGGKVLVNHKVDKILVEKNIVKGVKVKNKIFRSSIVVSNVNAKTTFLELVGEENLDKKFVEYIKNLRMSSSCFIVFLGVDIDLSNYPTLIKNLDEGYEIVINSNADSSLAPRGMSSITIITGASYHDFPPRGTEEYLKKKNKLAEILIQKIEKIIPDLSKHIVVQNISTPRTLERYTSMPEGAIYAFDQSIDVKRPYFKTPIKGLYLVGASTFPGGGIEAVTISGIICANDILGWKKKTKQ